MKIKISPLPVKLVASLLLSSSLIISSNVLADIVPGTVSTDLFDSTNGTIVTASDVISTTEDINAFRTSGGFEDGHVLMRKGGLGSESFIDFETTAEVAIKGVRLFAHNDGVSFSFRRAMSRFQLFADLDGDGVYETQAVDTDINVDYATQPGNQASAPTNLDLTLLTSNVVQAKHWRLIVTQGTNIGQFEGARLVEVDAIAANTPSCDIVPGISTDDVFDVSNGTIVVDDDVIVDPQNVFSTCNGFENGHTLMRDGGLNSTSFINFRTPQAVSIKGIRLFAHNDGVRNSFRRALNNFRLLADLDNNGDYETLVVESAVNADYATHEGNIATDPTNLDLTLLSDSVMTAQNWRIEVNQGTNIGQFEGARVVEVDAISPVVPEDSTTVSNSGSGSGSFQVWTLMFLFSSLLFLKRYK